jgi:acyl-CoA synthetase (AMP-forming)/AMP-acid ligase II
MNASMEGRGDHPLLRAGSPFEIAEDETSGPSFRRGPHTLNEVYRRARRMADKVLLVQDGVQLTYGEAFARAGALATHLARDHGVTAGDRVLVVLPNSPAWAIWFIALTALGATVVAIEPERTAEAIAQAAEISGARLAVGAAITNDAPWTVLASTLADAFDPADEDLALFERPGSPALDAVVAFTSGSTGRPKGVVHTHRSLLTGLCNGMLGAALVAAQRPKPTTPLRPAPPCTLLLAPLAYISGFSALVLAMMTFGRLVLAPRGAGMDAGEVAELVRSQGVRSIIGPSPALLDRLLALPDAAEALASLAGLHLHGSAIASGLADDVLARLPQIAISSSYGLTETAGTLAVGDFNDLRARPGAAGRPLPSIDLRIVTAHGDPAPAGETGAIQVRGVMLMRGYLTEAGLAATEGWFDTGDIGFLDAEGYLHTERDQPSIAVEGGAVSPRRIEELALAHPFVADAAACFWDAPSGRQRTVLAVERRAETTASLQDLIATVVARYAFAGDFSAHEVDRLPRRPSGKVDGEAVRRMLIAADR